jgi:hypothetical protein
LGSKLGVCGDIHKFADKFIAHAADFSSRSESTEAQKQITLAKITACHRAIVVVAGHISRWVLGDGASLTVPEPQFDPVENFDKRWIAKGELDEARQLWENTRLQ